MHLRNNETVIRIYHHHPFPYLIRVVKILLYVMPFYVLLFLFRNGMSDSSFVLAGSIITAVALLVLVYDGLIYWLERLIVTNYRVVHVDWKFFSLVHEYEAELTDIQHISTRETGIFSYFKIFDFGDFKLETSASRVTIFFMHAPDPEGMKKFIFATK